ncbi:MAG: MBL fold metallo-hydrolase, partial [Chthoniobacteraceae bacterium]
MNSRSLSRVLFFPALRTLCIAMMLVLLTAVSFRTSAAEPGKFTLTALNIPDVQRGAGLALVLQLPDGKTWLYDTGSGYPAEEGWAGDFNAGRDLVVPFLKERGITDIAGVMMSHAHYDHFGGLVWLKDNFPIGQLIDSGYEFPGASKPDYSTE